MINFITINYIVCFLQSSNGSINDFEVQESIYLEFNDKYDYYDVIFIRNLF